MLTIRVKTKCCIEVGRERKPATFCLKIEKVHRCLSPVTLLVNTITLFLKRSQIEKCRGANNGEIIACRYNKINKTWNLLLTPSRPV